MTVLDVGGDPSPDVHAGTPSAGPGPVAMRPVVDWLLCEGDATCVNVCPHDVFEVRPLDEMEEAALPFWVALRTERPVALTATAPYAARCHGCGACVGACPSRAIALVAL